MGKTYIDCANKHPLKRNCINCSHQDCDIRTEQEVEGHEEKAIIMHNEDIKELIGQQGEFEFNEV